VVSLLSRSWWSDRVSFEELQREDRRNGDTIELLLECEPICGIVLSMARTAASV
jgi:hypothetical protein